MLRGVAQGVKATRRVVSAPPGRDHGARGGTSPRGPSPSSLPSQGFGAGLLTHMCASPENTQLQVLTHYDGGGNVTESGPPILAGRGGGWKFRESAYNCRFFCAGAYWEPNRSTQRSCDEGR